MAHRFEPRFKCIKYIIVIYPGILFPEALQITEYSFVNKTDQSIQFKKRILQRCGREQQLMLHICEREFERVCNHVRRFVNVAEPVGFVHDHQIPFGI